MGMPLATLAGWATIIVELLGGLLIMLGAFIPVAAIPMAAVLIVAIVSVHLPNGFSSIKLQSFGPDGAHFGQPGYETDLLYLAGLAALCIGGAGFLSIDGWMRRRLAHRSALTIHAACPGPDFPDRRYHVSGSRGHARRAAPELARMHRGNRSLKTKSRSCACGFGLSS